MAGFETLPNPPPSASDVRRERIIASFEAAWDEGLRPRIADFLPPDDAERQALLAKLAQTELELGLKAGEAVRVEAYLTQYPELGKDPSVVLDLIAAEWEQRRRHEQDLTPVEYLERFPHYRDQLAALLPGVNGATVSYAPPPASSQPPTVFKDQTPPVLGLSATEPSVEESEIPTGVYTGGSDLSNLKESGPTVQSDAPPQTPPTGPPEGESVTPVLGGKVHVAGYEILGELGRGGMGVVYKARQKKLKRMVALKMILAGAHAGPAHLARFRTEAEAVARLQHPNIVQIFEIGEQDNLSYIALEYVSGGSLSHKLRGKPLPDNEAAALLEVLARAMHFAHQQGIIHRDLKPANVLLTADGQPKITDFGLAKKIDEAAGTATGAILGTPCYMAPEQAGGRSKETGPLADVYALGAMLYEFVTGRPPFNAPRPLDTVMQVLHNEPVPPSRFQPKVARDLETICLKCLQKNPARRYASAEDLADDVRRFLDGKAIRARPVPVWERVGKWARRRKALATALGLSFLLGISLLVIGLLMVKDRLARERATKKAEEEVTRLIDRAQLAARSEDSESDWKSGRDVANQALERIDAEPALAALRPKASAIRDEAEKKIKSRGLRNEFFGLRDRALFLHATLATGDGSRLNRAATGARARDALRHIGVSVGSPVAPALDSSFNTKDKEQILGACYELVLVLAELEPPEQAQRTLEWGEQYLVNLAPDLKQSPEPRWPPRAFYRRLERCYERLPGKNQECARAREEADRRPSTALDYYLEGDEYFRNDDLGKAEEAFQKALGQEPNDFWARYFLSVCFLLRDRPDLAEQGFNYCLDQRHDFVWLYLMRGYARAQLAENWGRPQQYEAAEQDYQAALKLIQVNAGSDTEAAGNPAARYVLLNNRAVMRFGQRRFADGYADLREAIGTSPRQYKAYVSLGTAYQEEILADAPAPQAIALMVGRADALVSSWLLCRYRQALDRSLAAFDQAVDRAKDLVQAGEERKAVLARLYSNRALLHQKRGDRAAALADFDRAIQAGTPGSRSIARAYASKGRLLELDGRFADAVQAYNAAIKSQPNYTDPYLWKAEALYQIGTPAGYAEAIDSVGRYLTHDGEPTAAAYKVRGLAHMKLLAPGTRHQALALNDFTNALRLDPADGSLYVQRGYAYLEGTAYSPAEDDFSEALTRDALAKDAYLGRAWARVMLGRTAEAVADVEKAVQRATEPDARLLRRAARTYAQAAANLQAQLGTRDRRIIDNYGAYQDRAVALLRQALEAQPRTERAAFWQKEIEPDRALRPLHRNTAYQELAERFAGPRGRSNRPE
jgi:serine/threonine protein kinase/tetratricopeptide (TPR) repeat protein